MKHTAHSFNFTLLSGEILYLKDLYNKSFMVINTASTCGFQYQFAQLTKLLNQFSKEDFAIIAVPCNDFLSQEPLSNDQLLTYYKNECENLYITQLTEVLGFNTHPFYSWIRMEHPIAGKPWWNYHKLLFNKTGIMSNWFSSLTKPNHQRVISSIQRLILES